MNKSILIKSGIILVVLAVVHSVFWFFKTGQVEKQINNFISENSSRISAGEVAVSGFPLKQKVSIKDLKFSAPNSMLNKYQITVSRLEATAGIFNSDFTIAITDQVLVQDNETNNSGHIEFSKEPEITASISEGMITKFSYHDLGHRVLDADKNVVYATSAASFTSDLTVEEGDKIKNKILVDLKDIEGFDILSIYKNSSEKKLIEGIKTGEITIGNSGALNAAPVDAAPIAAPTAAPAITALPILNNPTAAAATPAPSDPSAVVEIKTEDLSAAVSTNLVKSNFTADIEYLLSPAQQGEQQTNAAPSDPTQIQETPIQYSKSLKINSLELSNPLYKISVNGQLNIFQDDSLPSGAVTVKVEKIDNLINHVASGLNQIADQKAPAPIIPTVQSADLAAANPANVPTVDPTQAVPSAVVPASSAVLDEAYQSFLKRFTAGLASVTKEVSTKNQLSKDDVAVFDVRREKNIEFLINETPMREILGKF